MSSLPEGDPPVPVRGAGRRADTRTNFKRLHRMGMSEDTPAFRRKLRTEYENSVAFKVKAKKLVSAVEAFLASLGGVSSLADCVEEILPGDAIASPTGGGAHDAVGLLTPLSAMTESFCAQVRAMVVDPINSYVEDELQAAQQQYTSFLEEEKRVEKTRAEYLSMKSDTGREFLATKEKSYSEELFKLELVRFDTATKLEEVETRTDGTNALFWQRYLHAFANCQAGFYEEAAAYMRESAFHGEGGRQLAEKISAQEGVIEAQRQVRAAMRDELAVASPTIAASDATVIMSGWLQKQSFNIDAAERSAIKTAIGGWKKRWFILRQDGMMLYYKAEVVEGGESGESCSMPVDLRQVTEVTDPDTGQGLSSGGGGSGQGQGGDGSSDNKRVSGSGGSGGGGSGKHGSGKTSTAFAFTFGGRSCGLKAESAKEKEAWLTVLRQWLTAHEEERKAFAAKQDAKYAVKGTGVRDLDYAGGGGEQADEEVQAAGDAVGEGGGGSAGGETTTTQQQRYRRKAGFLYQHESATGKSWKGKRRWCELNCSNSTSAGAIALKLYDIDAIAATMEQQQQQGGGGQTERVKGQSSSSSSWLGEPMMEFPLMLATVKEEREAAKAALRFCFKVISPQQELLLQCTSNDEMEEWLDIVQHAISEGLNAQMSGGGGGRGGHGGSGGGAAGADDEEGRKVLKRLTADPASGNGYCADCGCAAPDWASINLGVLLCLDCSGVHRRLGVHISKVRSAILDVKQWTPELLDVFEALGNTKVNALAEATLTTSSTTAAATNHDGDGDSSAQSGAEAVAGGGGADGGGGAETAAATTTTTTTTTTMRKPTPSSSRPEKEAFIRAKYETRQFVSTADVAAATAAGGGGGLSEDELGRALMKAVISGDLVNTLKVILICGGGIVDWRDPEQGKLSALHCAAAAGHKAVIELLLLNGADINVQGGTQGKSPLHLAVMCKKVAACELLIAKGALVGLPDDEGNSACDVAATCGVPIIAGMLRLAKAAEDDARQRADALRAARLSAQAN